MSKAKTKMKFTLQERYITLNITFKENATITHVKKELEAHGINVETFTCKICKAEYLNIDKSIEEGVCVGCYKPKA